EAIRRIHRANPSARILATGCYAQRAPEELAALPGVAWVVGNSHQQHIGSMLAESSNRASLAASSAGSFVPLVALNGAVPMPLAHTPKILSGNIFETDEVFVGPTAGLAGRTRPVLKVQDGCNNRCSYCVIPFVRGRSRSLAPERVKEEVSAMAAAGAREVVLSGINLGAYGRDLAPRVPLGDLLARLVEETPIERLRLSSIEPMDVTLDLVALVARTGRIAPHFHVPLQSGSDPMLAAMHRWYRAAHYAERILLVAERLPGAAIGADVICGFPGETEDDHQRTVDLIERLPFTYLHVFSYSSRPGTKAAGMCRPVAPAAIRARSRELRALSERKAAEFRASQGATRQRVLTLERRGKTPAGHDPSGGVSEWTAALTGNYLHVRVAGRWPKNTWLDVNLTPAEGHMRGDAEVLSGGMKESA
ncbi:MAG TPA: MiaB/RimO family radical SAM methylthiotransferase, partial [Candidatus Acidoferrales bacterium]|nr:MiaB/RimO family radical SAM methylthiotransferase [Candidatus Acidoferrales bacterium]